MEFRSPEFKTRAVHALHDANLQKALSNTKAGFVVKRAQAAAEMPEFEALRDTAAEIKNHVLANLDHYLEKYEAAVTAAGGHVHYATDAEDARRIILGICKKANAKRITKGKSMVSEEMGLNEALIADGYEVVETDLGEYIIQLADEPPSHIIAPAIHKTKDQVADLFAAAHNKPRKTDRAELVAEAREVLREKYFTAEVGITGGNFLVAETGSSVIVTNEGNGDLTQTLAKVHIVTSGIERVIPTLDDLSVFLRILARSATGQETESYTTFSTGPRREGDIDGPEEYHVVLLDNGRSKMLGSRFQDMLRCIRCGACMNHCPVYGSIGGHAYGWVYPGPMGSVLTPLIKGMDGTYDLPNACTLNGRCKSVCPVRIPLPDLLREIRHNQFRQDMTPKRQKQALKLWRYVAERPKLYHFAERIGVRILASMANGKGKLRSLPFDPGWTGARDLPAPTGRTFLELWQAKRGDK
ncbi:LutB/LldF family L-lactate oxidation iron-sulfur protein [Denitromonas ohlonensis]|uniref:Iron-sulfur cluster-binding protein n=2 Tax=Denitromonas TaxID=139331 RepID=A0A557SL87_9RHOO|nr:LutB/LldF family L-lactate oxidation iron-sulfur protein [Denitromonas ohlonensis]TVO67899.1 iron-sulfur cluster-binding protein [Denitromonas ohlonensis]TVO78196.1 iron-sulfur cluster-binding protein [Denitromonas ohlonensis]